MKGLQFKNPRKVTRGAYICEAGFEYFISLFVTTNFLVFVLKELGVSDSVSGIISSVASFAYTAQLFSLFLVGRRAKRIVTVGHIINQGCFVVLYLLPIVTLPPATKTALFIVLLLLGHFLNNAINATKITWLMKSVPDEKRGIFTSVKEIVSLVGGMAISLGFGVLADHFRNADGTAGQAYYIICISALAALAILHTVTLLISHEPPLAEDDRPISPLQVLRDTVADKSLLKVMGLELLWHTAVAFSVGFFASYQQQELGFTMTTITAITIGASLCRIVVSPLLGMLADKTSFVHVMQLSFGIACVGFAVNIFTAPQTGFLFPVYLCLYYAAMGGINSGTINLIYDYVEPKKRSATLGLKNTFSGICSFLAALAGGLILDIIQEQGGVSLFGITLYAQQFLSLITAALILAAIVYTRILVLPLQRVTAKESQ